MRHKGGAATLAASISIVLITVLTVAGELVPVISSALKAVTGNGWITKGLVGLIAFVALTAILGSGQSGGDKADAGPIYRLIVTTLVCALALFLFYMFNFVAG